jgi:hypothetical protein
MKVSEKCAQIALEEITGQISFNIALLHYVICKIDSRTEKKTVFNHQRRHEED